MQKLTNIRVIEEGVLKMIEIEENDILCYDKNILEQPKVLPKVQ